MLHPVLHVVVEEGEEEEEGMQMLL